MKPSLAALALLAPLSACGGGGELVEAGDVTILVGEDTGSGMDALLSGELTVIDGVTVPDDCADSAMWLASD